MASVPSCLFPEGNDASFQMHREFVIFVTLNCHFASIITVLRHYSITGHDKLFVAIHILAVQSEEMDLSVNCGLCWVCKSLQCDPG